MRARDGDLGAFQALVEASESEIYGLAAAIVGPADAWDVAQEAYVMAWRQLPRLRNPESFRPWIRQICANTARNWLRHSARRPTTSLDDSSDDLGIRDVTDFRSAVEARAILAPAFELLTPDQRALLALHYGMGLSISEAASTLGLRVGTAKSRLSAALATLRRLLTPDGVTEAAS